MNQTNAHLPRRERFPLYQTYDTGSRAGPSSLPGSQWNRETVEGTQVGKVGGKSLRAELDETKDKLRKSEAEVQRLSDYVREQNVNLSKLQETVKIQSQQIQKNPEPSKNAQRRIEGSLAQQNRQYSEQSQRYGPGGMQQGQGYRVQSQHGQQTFTQAQQNQLTFTQAQHNQQNLQMPTPLPPNVSNQLIQRPASIMTAPVTVIHRSANAGQMIQTEHATEFEFTGKASHMFRLIEDWAKSYCNTLPASGGFELTESLMNGLKQTCGSRWAMGDVLKSEHTRYFLAASYVNAAMTSRIFRIQIIRGFNATQEEFIKEIKSKIKPGMQTSIRAAYQQVIADTVTRMRSSPGFQEWLILQAKQFTKAVIVGLRPLLDPGAERAAEDLFFILHQAFKIGVDMHTINRTYSFDYCQTGTESWFNPAMMVNRDPEVQGDPVSIKHQNYHVRLCMNPVVTMTNLVGNAIVPKTMHLAEVLLFK